MQGTAKAGIPAAERQSAGQKAPLWLFRLTALAAGMAIFFPPVNPGRISEKINSAASLFTTGISRDTITNSMGRILRSQWIQDQDITLLMIACVVTMVGVLACAAGACMSLGNRKMRKTGLILPIAGAPVAGAGLLLIHKAYQNMTAHGEGMTTGTVIVRSLRSLPEPRFSAHSSTERSIDPMAPETYRYT